MIEKEIVSLIRYYRSDLINVREFTNSIIELYKPIESSNAKLLETNKELLEACKKALPHHQGGHSEVGFMLKQAIKNAEV